MVWLQASMPSLHHQAYGGRICCDVVVDVAQLNQSTILDNSFVDIGPSLISCVLAYGRA